MQVLNKLKTAIQNAWSKIVNRKNSLIAAQERIARLERNYIVLLKRVLEMDGVKLTLPKSSAMDSKIFQTVNDENNQHGLNEPKPTLH